METKSEPRDVYEIVTDRILKELEQGVVPWQKPWTEAGPPQNLLSRKPYRGINVWLLATLGYEQNFFLTFKQIKELGGLVKKGERSFPVIFWKWVEEEDKETNEVKRTPFLRYHTVFNIAQCEGIPAEKIPTLPVRQNNPIEACEEILYKMPYKPRIKHKEQKAFYYPEFDFINMPRFDSFKDSQSYYVTLFHELIHSTGHKTRLNRKELMAMQPFGSKDYSIEELTAEMGACYLSSFAGIAKEMTNSIAYLQGWLDKLKKDKRMLVYAAAHAQKATDYIFNIKFEDKEAVTREENES